MGTVAEYLDLQKGYGYTNDPVSMAMGMGILAPDLMNHTLDEVECTRLGIEWPGKPFEVKKFGNVIADYGVDDLIVGGVRLALTLTPEIVREKLPGCKALTEPEIVISSGRLSLENKDNGAYVLLDDNDRPRQIRIGVPRLREIFGFDPNVVNIYDPDICFTAAVHEVADWIQQENGLHDCIHRPEDEDTKFWASHSTSIAEHVSNQVATELAQVVYGLTVTLT